MASSSKPRYEAEKGYEAMLELGKSAKKNGLSGMTLDEINAEIAEARKKGKEQTESYDTLGITQETKDFIADVEC